MTHPRDFAKNSVIFLAALAAAVSGCGRGGGALVETIDVSEVIQPSPQKDLVPFRSEAALRRYLEAHAASQRARLEGAVDSSPASPPAAGNKAEDSNDDGGSGESITNNQEAGVDEGGIVKARGDYLIVLRRGRLFSIRVGDGERAPVSMVDAFPPGAPQNTWYDEMLVSQNTIVVVGYSYSAGATELGIFDLGDDGMIRYRSTYFLRSNDYYSSRNYASRLLGDKLVFYMPYSLAGAMTGSGELALPGVRKLDPRKTQFDSIIRATQIYRPIQETDWPVLHTVVTCDLGGRELDCTARGVIGPYGRTFYVSPTAVYVWVSGGHSVGLDRAGIAESPAVVYRMPLDGGEVGALRVRGGPIDQFSFRESPDQHLNVLVRAEGGGDWMWGPEVTGGDVALLRVPLAGFSQRVGSARDAAYAALPRPGAGWTMHNRFVGDHVLYGTGSGWGRAETERDDRIYIYPYRGGNPEALELPHGVDRIEAMGAAAVVIGTDGSDLHFSAIELAARPRIAGRFVQQNASQGETRSHGFFYRPLGEDEGVLGLPVTTGPRPGYAQLVHGSAEVLFLAVDDLHFRRLGSLASHDSGAIDDRCVVSCVDWYGNARPIFYRGRVFALLGYELVEGRIAANAIREVGRVNFFMKNALRIAQ